MDYEEVAWQVRRARRGDEDAFRLLLESHRGKITGTLVACGIRDQATAEDLAQEVALKAWQAIGGLKDPRSFTAWFRRIAANAARDALRSRTGEEMELREALHLEGGDSPYSLVERRQGLSRRVRALQCLDPDTQELLLASAEGRTAVELAQELGVTPEAVRMRLMRARRRLRAQLDRVEGAEGGEDPDK